MRERIITALFFVLVMALGIFGGEYAFLALILFIVVMSYLEFFTLAQYEGRRDFRQILAIFCGVSPLLFVFAQKLNLGLTHWSPTDYVVLLIPFLMLFYMLELFYESKDPVKNLGTVVLSYVYIALPYVLLVEMAYWQGFYQPWLVLGLLLLVWLNDTGAYFTGVLLGRHLLAPKISPKKTWEGLFGGVVATLLTSQILAAFLVDYSKQQWLIIGFISSLGILGDLIESLLKRRADVKDSGSLMPGHGGVLDRFDAFQFVIPAIFLYFYYFI